MRSGLALILCVFGLLAGCGGEDGAPTPPPTSNNPPPPPPPPVTGAAGGTITETSGATVIVPAGALSGDTTIRIAQDSTGAPALPAGLTGSGSTYVVTPHGGDFAVPIEVSIPAPSVTLLPTQELKLAKAQPGGEWAILDDTVLVDGKLKTKVTSFSFFMTVIVTYPLPILQAEPLALTATLTCGGQDCGNAVGPVNITYTVVGNNGQLPANCPGGELQYQEFANGTFTAPVTMPRTGFTITKTIPPNYLDYTFIAFLRCPTLHINGGSPWARRLSWPTPPRYPNLSILRAPAQLDVVEGMPAQLEVLLSGGAVKYVGNPDSATSSTPTASDRAIVEWQRSDDGGASWRTIAYSFQNEANPQPFGTGFTWRPWSVRHGFIATWMDQGAQIRAQACYTPPAGTAAPPCVISPTTLLNVLQQSALPAIVTAPRSVLVRTGQTANLSVTIAGSPTPTLQWQSRPANSNSAWSNVTSGTGATAANYVSAATNISDNGTQYRVLLTNAVGSAASGVVTVSVSDVDVAPGITTQPASLSVASGSDAVFAVDARGTEALSYQWYRNGTALAGANSPVLRLNGVSLLDSGSFTVTVSNAAGDEDSNAATLSVYPGAPAAVAPAIVTQPTGVSASAGSTVTFAVGVDGSGPFTFQWRRNGTNITGATSAVLTFNSVALPNAGTFSVVVTNSAGSVTSGSAVLDVTAATSATAPSITSQPATLIVPYRGSGVVAVGATGSGPLSYQWSKNGEELPGLTMPVLDFRIVAEQDVGTYTVTITNGVGSVTSQAASIILLGAPVITQQPADVSVLEGANATFFVAANSSGLRYQWSRNGSPIPGAIGATLNTGPTVGANSGAVYSVMVYNGAGHVYSQGAVLTVQVVVAPSITIQPQARTIQPGQTAPICAAVAGTAPFAVLLQRWGGTDWATVNDNIVFSDNVESCLATPVLQAGDSGAIFRFVVSNAAGTNSTEGATITVQAPSTGLSNTTLVSRALIGGGPPNNISNQPSISADGRYVAFVSIGTNLWEGGVNNGNAYVRDMQTGVTRLINMSYDGHESGQGVSNVKLSSNGRYALFTSRADDLVPGDTNNSVDVFRRDLQTGTNLRVSVLPNGDELENGISGGSSTDAQLDISGDGQVVIFVSAYSIDGDSGNNGYYHLYYRNVSSGFSGHIAGSSEYQVAYSALSDNGEHVAFAMGVTSRMQRIEVYDIEASRYFTAFELDLAEPSNGLYQGISVSDYGRYVAFSIVSPDLLGSTRSQVLVADRNLQTYVVASQKDGVPGDGNSAWPEISGDGRFVMFSSIAPSLTNNLATSSAPYVVVRDLAEQKTSVASLRPNGTEVSAGLYVNDQHALSHDGTTLAFVADYDLMAGQMFGDQVFAASRP